MRTALHDAPPDDIASRGDAAALVDAWRAFWANAGVDCAFDDDAHDWLAESEPPAEQQDSPAKRPRPVMAKQAEKPRIGGARESWPQTLDAMRDWWLTEASLDAGPVDARVPPQGIAGARLMVLVTEPEAEDRDALLTGPAGRMLDAMLSAMGLTRADCYIASVLPRHTPAPDWRMLFDDGMGDVLRHHVALARPQLLAVFGGDALRMLGPDMLDQQAGIGSISPAEDAGEIPIIASYGLDVMLRRPRAKAGWWHRWLLQTSRD